MKRPKALFACPSVAHWRPMTINEAKALPRSRARTALRSMRCGILAHRIEIPCTLPQAMRWRAVTLPDGCVRVDGCPRMRSQATLPPQAKASRLRITVLGALVKIPPVPPHMGMARMSAAAALSADWRLHHSLAMPKVFRRTVCVRRPHAARARSRPPRGCPSGRSCRRPTPGRYWPAHGTWRSSRRRCRALSSSVRPRPPRRFGACAPRRPCPPKSRWCCARTAAACAIARTAARTARPWRRRPR